jgi:RNA polymerase sigma-70 factor (ECF subfamily)
MWPEQHQTGSLLKLVSGGEADAVNQLMERHRPALRRMIEMRLDRQIRARVDASDVVQDVLIEAAQRMRAYLEKPDIPFHLWLRQMAQDRIIDLHRRHHAQRRSVDMEQSMAAAFPDQSSLDLMAQIQDSELTPAAAALRSEMERRFHQALTELDDDDREIILMRHAEHLGNGEVAQALNLTPAAAGMRYLRAIRRLKDVLGDG